MWKLELLQKSEIYMKRRFLNDIISTNMQFGNDHFRFMYPVTCTDIQGQPMSM